MTFHTDTPVTVTLTMGRLYAIIAGLVGLFVATIGGVWYLTTSTVGDIRGDVKEIRKGLTENVKVTNDVNLGLTREISGLRVDLAGLAPKIDGLNATIGKLEYQIASIQSPWTDPKTAVIFVENLKKAGVIVAPQPPPPNPQPQPQPQPQ
jgi:hypothetical protein